MFVTTRETVKISPTLFTLLEAAEKNQKLLTGDGAVFVDRDPQVFHVILEHMRNKRSGMVRPGVLRSTNLVSELTVEFEPLNTLELREVYVEAQFYGLANLKDQTNTFYHSVGVMRRFAPTSWLNNKNFDLHL